MIFQILLILFKISLFLPNTAHAENVVKIQLRQFIPNMIIKDPFSTALYAVGSTLMNMADGKKTSDSKYDAVFAKLDMNGTLIFSTIIGGPGDQFGYKLMLNKDDKSWYVVGSTRTAFDEEPVWSGDYSKLFIVKFDSEGNKKWSRIFGNGSGSKSVVFLDAVLFGSLKQAMILSLDTKTYGQFMTRFINTETGQIERVYAWNDGVQPIGLGYDTVRQCALVVGMTSTELDGTSSGQKQGFIARISSDGKFADIYYLGPYVSPLAIIHVATSDRFYIAGEVYVGGLDTDAFLMAFSSSDGKMLWRKKFGGKGQDVSYLLDFNPVQQNIAVAGIMNNPAVGDWDAFLATYDEKGARTFIKEFKTDKYDFISTISVDQFDGSIYIVEDELENDQKFDVYLHKISNYLNMNNGEIVPEATDNTPVEMVSHGLSGWAIFFIVTSVLGVVCGAGYYGWRHYHKDKFVYLPMNDFANPLSPLQPSA